MSIKLNIGAGDTVIDGYTPIDRKLGTEAYPLPYADNSVEDIRCSHMLEHLSFAEVQDALREWHRVLKPGGRLRVAVPDVRKILASIDTNDSWRFNLMGGQTDTNNFHKSAFDEELLYAHLEQFGFENIRRWESPNTDTAAHPMSLNLEGFKKPTEPQTVKICAICSIPRVGWNDFWGGAMEALRPFNIPVRRFTGAFWGQCMERALEDCVKDGLDWVLCLDYDTMFTAEHLDRLMGWFGEHPEIDALAGLQARRQGDTPLMTVYGEKGVEVDGSPIKVTTAHFGLTLLRVEALADLKKPWFKSEPDSDGRWGDGRLDEDIWFWHQWRLAGKTIYVAPDVRIGHMQLMVSQFNEQMQVEHIHVSEWRDQQKKVSA